MTNLEKAIYNTYLRVSRSRHNKPYKLRKNFDSFENNENYIYVKRLSSFFKKYPHIRLDDFFTCPYEVYPDVDTYDLRFYTTPKAIKIYGTYNVQKDNEDPDGEYQVKFVTDSLMFIFTFCKQNNLLVDEYIHHKTNDLHTFIEHIRERKVSFYTLFGFNEFGSIMGTYPRSRIQFTLGKNFENNLDLYRTRYYNSRKAKTAITSGLAKIEELLKRYKKQQNNI